MKKSYKNCYKLFSYILPNSLTELMPIDKLYKPIQTGPKYGFLLMLLLITIRV